MVGHCRTKEEQHLSTRYLINKQARGTLIRQQCLVFAHRCIRPQIFLQAWYNVPLTTSNRTQQCFPSSDQRRYLSNYIRICISKSAHPGYSHTSGPVFLHLITYVLSQYSSIRESAYDKCKQATNAGGQWPVTASTVLLVSWKRRNCASDPQFSDKVFTSSRAARSAIKQVVSCGLL